MSTPFRLERARDILAARSLEGLLVSRTAGKRWLSGFVLLPGEEPTSGWSGTLLVTSERTLLFADGRYEEQAASQCPGWEIRHTDRLIHQDLPPAASSLGVRRIGAESEVLSHADWTALADAGLALEPVDRELEALRLLKDDEEVEAVAHACATTDACFSHLLETVRPGMTEREIGWEIGSWFRANGADGNAFDPLVLVGARAAMPHGHPSDTPVAHSQPLLIDFGAQVDGYRADMTRTIFFGQPEPEARRRYEAVRDAQQRAFEAAAVGVIGADLHGVARDALGEQGLAAAFTHGLGHGIGLETHEEPKLKSWKRPLEAGMVFTIEPGVYLPGEIGIRIEDTVHLTDAGAVRLTDSPRELLVL